MTTIFCAECRVAIRTALYDSGLSDEKLIANVCDECRQATRLQMDELRASVHAAGQRFPAAGNRLRTVLWEKRQ